MKALEKSGYEFKDYYGMMPEMDSDALIIDDISEYEMEMSLKILKPDVFCAGIKEKYGIQKYGIPCKQLHNYDVRGPYAGFLGAINFYKDIDMITNNHIWAHIKAPWQKSPELAGKFGNQ